MLSALSLWDGRTCVLEHAPQAWPGVKIPEGEDRALDGMAGEHLPSVGGILGNGVQLLGCIRQEPVVGPLGIDEIFWRLISKCVLWSVWKQAKPVYGTVNLYAGLPDEI